MPLPRRRAYHRKPIERLPDEPIFHSDTDEEGKAVVFWGRDKPEAIVLFKLRRGRSFVVTTETFTADTRASVEAALEAAGWEVLPDEDGADTEGPSGG